MMPISASKHHQVAVVTFTIRMTPNISAMPSAILRIKAALKGYPERGRQATACALLRNRRALIARARSPHDRRCRVIRPQAGSTARSDAHCAQADILFDNHHRRARGRDRTAAPHRFRESPLGREAEADLVAQKHTRLVREQSAPDGHHLLLAARRLNRRPRFSSRIGKRL